MNFKKQLTNKFINFSVLLITLILVYIITEIILNAYFPPSAQNYWEFNEFFDHTFVSNLNVSVYGGDGQKIDLVTDSQGFRSKEFNYSKDNSVKRIMVLGDSVTASTGVTSAQMFTTILSQSLNNAELLPNSYIKHKSSANLTFATQNKHKTQKSNNGKVRWEVINRGIEAWGLDVEHNYWFKDGRRYKPDILLLQLHMNDFDDAVTAQLSNPDLNFSSLFLYNTTTTAAGFVVVDKFRYESLSNKMRLFLNRHSALYRLIAKFYYAHFKFRSHYEPAFYQNSSYTDVFYAIFKRLAVLIEEINNDAKKDGVEFIIILYQEPRTINNEYYAYWDKIYERAGKKNMPQKDMQVPLKLIKDFLQKNSIKFIDTAQTINAMEDFVSVEDGHLSAVGNKKMADLIFINLRR